MTNKRVMTIQDISCLGQCSLTVALPIISACGVETIILPSAVLSTHTGGFTDYTFRDLTDDIPDIMRHWVKEKQKFDCIYTGYLGSITQIDYVDMLIENILNEGALKVIDPAMADNGSLYYGFNDEFVKRMAGLCGKADVVLPNITEASFMTGMEYIAENHDEKYINELLMGIKALGAKKIILKGISYESDKIGVAVYDCMTDDLQYYFTEKIPQGSHGTGDCYAAAFVGALMQGRNEYEAAKLAADFVLESIKQTIDDNSHWYGVKFERALPILVNELNK
ncbi:MAG: pyridoxamine kinase [Coprococcus sp.]